jgi:hypothetical protein
MGQPTGNQAGSATMVRPRRRHPVIDVVNCAVRGDYTPHLGVPGLLTQAVLGYVPVIGTCCAARDYLADRRHGDNLGAVLNALSLIPFLGGFPKTAHVVRSVRSIGQTGYTAYQLRRAMRAVRAR